MRTQADFYRGFRHQYPALPATVAWTHARHANRVEQWADSHGFDWYRLEADPRLFYTRWFDYARWSEWGYDVQAWIDVDDNGWDLYGTQTIGSFQRYWQAGAIEHERFGNQALAWFVPADANRARALYERACGYDDDWEYLDARVTVSRAGTVLSTASMGGIESDRADSDYLTRTVFDLKCEATDRAECKLRELCRTCH